MGHNPNREELMLWAASLKEREASLAGKLELMTPFNRPIPIVRVKPDSKDVLKLHPKALGPNEINEDYWESVLRDRRLRTDSSEMTLGMFQERDSFSCARCKRQCILSSSELLRRYGPKYQVRFLAYEVLVCLGRFKDCKGEYGA